MFGYQDPPHQIEFETLQLPKTPNFYLMCPLHFSTASPHCISPLFPVSIAVLQNNWDKMIAVQPWVKLVASNPLKHQYTYIQRSKWFRFPDTINIRLIAVEGGATLAIYSAAKYGRYDFGVNKKRVLSWVESLQNSLSA